MANIRMGFLKRVLKKYGTYRVKKFLWNTEFSAGKWDFIDHTSGDIIYHYLEKYSNYENILDLGCGSGNTGNELHFSSYNRYTGVDISERAIQKAIFRTMKNSRSEKNEFIISDIFDYEPNKKYDIILFRESIFYIPTYKITSMLNKYSRYLKKEGVFIISMYDVDKFNNILNLIQREYALIEKHVALDSKDIIAVFR